MLKKTDLTLLEKKVLTREMSSENVEKILTDIKRQIKTGKILFWSFMLFFLIGSVTIYLFQISEITYILLYFFFFLSGLTGIPKLFSLQYKYGYFTRFAEEKTGNENYAV
jgi:hypothetical protein